MAWHAFWAGAGGGFWWIFPLLWALLWGSLIILGVWAIRRLFSRGPESALDILKRRLASGEISEDDYDRTRRALQ
jgi:putative membrane protein